MTDSLAVVVDGVTEVDGVVMKDMAAASTSLMKDTATDTIADDLARASNFTCTIV